MKSDPDCVGNVETARRQDDLRRRFFDSVLPEDDPFFTESSDLRVDVRVFLVRCPSQFDSAAGTGLSIPPSEPDGTFISTAGTGQIDAISLPRVSIRPDDLR